MVSPWVGISRQTCPESLSLMVSELCVAMRW